MKMKLKNAIKTTGWIWGRFENTLAEIFWTIAFIFLCFLSLIKWVKGMKKENLLPSKDKQM